MVKITILGEEILHLVLLQFISNQIELYFLYLGAFGYFECTHNITKYTKAKPFEFVGKKTPLAVRFSTVGEFIHQMSLISHDVSTVMFYTFIWMVTIQ